MINLFNDINALYHVVWQVLWPSLLVFLRIGAMVAVLPGLGEGAIPVRVKLALALAMTAVVMPAASFGPDAPLADWLGRMANGPAPLMIELCIGLVLGLSLRFMMFGLQMAGSIAAQTLSLAQMFGGIGPDPQPVIANMMLFSGMAVFAAMGGLGRAVDYALRSYADFPAAVWPSAAALAQWALAGTGRALALAFMFSAPMLLTGLIYNLALGAMNRAMPMLMVVMITAPALSLGGMLLLATTLPLLLHLWQAEVLQLLSTGP